MPFTFAHPALVLPATRLPARWYSLTGLIVGSMSPDFEYFIRMRIYSSYSHSLWGLFYFDLPAGLLAAFLFHDIARNSLYDHLPYFLKARVYDFKGFNWNKYFRSNWLVVILSLLVGTASHIFWDNFTHSYGYFAREMPVLQNKVMILGHPVRFSSILQHVSTVVGLVVVTWALARLPLTTKHIHHAQGVKYKVTLTGVFLAVFALRFINGIDIQHYGNIAATCISALFISIIFTPLILKLLTKTV